MRPTVTAAPDVAELGDTIFVETPDAASITKALWVVPGAVTHAQNWTQRANTLDFTAVDGGINIQLPASENEAPVGYYMLFLVNDQGVPSVAEWVRATSNILLPGDFNGDDVVSAADYTAWRNGLGSKYTETDYGVWKASFGQSNGAGAGMGAGCSPNSRAVDPHGAGPRGDRRCQLSRSASQFDLLTLAFEASCGRLQPVYGACTHQQYRDCAREQ